MLTGFVTFEDFHGRKDIGSSRIRARWLVERWADAGPDLGRAEIFKFGRKYDAVVYQKAYWWQHAEAFKGVKILDVCDPDFLQWGYPIRRMIDACDAVTCPTEKLAVGLADFAGGKPVWIIPDCVLDPGRLPLKQHRGDLGTIAWFGNYENFPVLDGAVPAIVKRDLELLVISNKAFTPLAKLAGEKLKLRNLPWSPDTWQNDLLKADLVINPRSNAGAFAYKSDNKTVQAWALGLPVALNDKEIDAMASAEARTEEGARRRRWVEENRNVKEAVKLMKELIAELSPAKP